VRDLRGVLVCASSRFLSAQNRDTVFVVFVDKGTAASRCRTFRNQTSLSVCLPTINPASSSLCASRRHKWVNQTLIGVVSMSCKRFVQGIDVHVMLET
jgi:hypothetical protein